ncbi:MAG: TonB family protein [Povalibacter sp.]
MSATLHAFPAGHSFNSPRSWAMAIIVVIHLAFFWLLTSGMARSLLILPPPATEAFVIENPVKPPPEFKQPQDFKVETLVYTPPVLQPPPINNTEEDKGPRLVTDDPPPLVEPAHVQPTQRTPIEVMPGIDPRHALSEPQYPASLIRQGIEGTVVLSVQVLENGRVGDVRIDSSSGDSRLDESAVREARRWRFVPGTRDGIPVVLWKQVPVAFRIEDRH